MTRPGLNVRVEGEHAKRLERLATTSGLTKAEVVAAALAAYFSDESTHPRDTTTAHRFDQLARRLEYLERDQTILMEMLVLFIRGYLSVTALVVEPHHEAACARGDSQFEQFIEQLARHLQRGSSRVKNVERKVATRANRLSAGEKKGVLGTSEVAA